MPGFGGGVAGGRDGNELGDSTESKSLNLTVCLIRHIIRCVSHLDKPLVWLEGEIKTPPFSKAARIEAGTLLRRLQRGELLALPQSRPMPSIGKRCHELRIPDETKTWRIVYRIDQDAIVIADVFAKKSRQTPKPVIATCQRRLGQYDAAVAKLRKRESGNKP